MIESRFNELKKIYETLNPYYDARQEDYWKQLTSLFTENEEETIRFLDNCSEEDVEIASEVFDNVAKVLQSLKFIDCLHRLEKKFPDSTIAYSVAYAEFFTDAYEHVNPLIVMKNPPSDPPSKSKKKKSSSKKNKK